MPGVLAWVAGTGNISAQWGNLDAPRQRGLEKQRAYVAPEHGVEFLESPRAGPRGIGAGAIYREDVEHLAERPIDQADQSSVAKHDDAAAGRPSSSPRAAPRR